MGWAGIIRSMPLEPAGRRLQLFSPLLAISGTLAGVGALEGPTPDFRATSSVKPLSAVEDCARVARDPVPGRVLWAADLGSGDLRSYRIDACGSNRVRVVKDPHGLDRNVLRLSVRGTDVYPCTPTRDPRAQASSPGLLREGGEYWIGWSILVPRRFPAAKGPRDNWISLASVYGPPFRGSGVNGLSMSTTRGSSKFYYRRSIEHRFDQPWSAPLVRGRWVSFVVHVRMSRSKSRGFREQWINTGTGWQRSLLHGRRRLRMRTMSSANAGGPNHSKLSLYYRRGSLGSASVYFAEHRVGTSFRAVAPLTPTPGRRRVVADQP